jgi:GGDEF domain-containing protein
MTETKRRHDIGGAVKLWERSEPLPLRDGSLQVALVEGDEMLRDTLAEFVGELGYSGHTWASLGELYEALQRGDATADLLLTEFLTGVADVPGGRDAMHTLRKLYVESPRRPVVLIASAREARLSAADAVSCGIHAFLHRPVSLTEFELVLHRLAETASEAYYRDEVTGLHNALGFTTLAENHLKLARRAKRDVTLLTAKIQGSRPGAPKGLIRPGDGVESLDRATRQALLDFAEIARDTFRDSDVLARTEPQRFDFLLLDAPSDGARIATERLQERVARRNDDVGRSRSLGLEVGVAHFDPSAPQSYDDLRREAQVG